MNVTNGSVTNGTRMNYVKLNERSEGTELNRMVMSLNEQCNEANGTGMSLPNVSGVEARRS